MKKKPQICFSDHEGSSNSKGVSGYLEQEAISVIISRSHAHHVERFIRTFKMMIRKRIHYDMNQGKKYIQWYMYEALLTYNNEHEHGTTRMIRAEATTGDNQLDVITNLELKAKTIRKYTELNNHDKVKIILKYDTFRKEHNPLYSDNKYEIQRLETKPGLNVFTVNGSERLRNELLNDD